MFLLIFSTKYYLSDLRDYDQSDKICKPYDYYEKDEHKFVSFLVHKSEFMCVVIVGVHSADWSLI